MKRRQSLTAILFLIILSICTLPLEAICGECNEVVMADNIEIQGKSLTLNGLGTRKATIFKVKVYVAGLYLLKQNSDPGQIINHDQPRHLALEFTRQVKMKDISKGWEEGFAKNSKNITSLQTRINQLNQAMRDINKGDTMTFSYYPGKGTSILINQEKITTIAGKDFASALIAIWLGTPPNKEIETGLLGGNC